MFKKISRVQIVFLGVLALVLASVFGIAFHSFAGTVSATTDTSVPNEFVTNGLNGTASVILKGQGSASGGVGLRIVYKKTSWEKWRNFGTKDADAPWTSVSSIPNGIDYPHATWHINYYGWRIDKDDRSLLNLQPSGKTIAFPALNLTKGTYEWSVQGVGRANGEYVYSSWAAKRTFVVKDPAPTCNLSASSTNIESGDSVDLTLTSFNAAGLQSSDFGASGISGNLSVSPGSSRSYTATVYNTNGDGSKVTGSCSVSINVRPVQENTEDSGNNNGSQAESSGSTETQNDPVFSYGGGSDESAAAEDKEPPSVPSDFRGQFSAETNSIELAWSASSDNTGVSLYEIERKEKNATDWQNIGTSEESTYVDFGFEPEKSYQYRARAIDAASNSSGYSNVADVTSGVFTANVTVNDGGQIYNEGKNVLVDVPKSAVSENIFLLIEKVKKSKLKLAKGTKIIGDVYQVSAKNSKGKQVTEFNTQITINFILTGKQRSSADLATLRIGTSEDEKNVDYLKTAYNSTTSEAKTLTDHLSLYFVTSAKTSPWLTLLKVFLWTALIFGLGAGGYYGWQKYQIAKYQKEHREDYIYKH